MKSKRNRIHAVGSVEIETFGGDYHRLESTFPHRTEHRPNRKPNGRKNSRSRQTKQ
jgi:hypothetical protein